jgi:hypothetical protein
MVILRGQLVLLILFSLASATAQLTEEDSKQRVSEFVRVKAGLRSDHFLRATRNEDLEDQLFSAQIKIYGQIRKGAHFYKITETGYEVVSPTEAVLHGTTYGHRSWLVAIDPASGNLFGLGGFGTEGQKSFNNLVVAARVRIDTKEASLNWAAFYVQAVLHEKADTLVTGETDLRRRVEDVVEAHQLSRKRPISAKRWLASLERSKTAPVYGISAMKEGDGFRVVADFLAATVAHNPQLVRLGLNVAGDGRVSHTSTSSIFPH